MSTKDLSAFMNPRSVALIGVPPRTGAGSFNVMENLLHCGFKGKIYPVNPSASEILGVKCYSRVADIPGQVDLAAIILGNRTVIPGVVKECVDKGIKALVILGQGFDDADDKEGPELQREILRIAAAGGARIVGPNTMGTANAFCNFSTGLSLFPMKKVPLGVICQSGIAFTGSGNMSLLGKGFDLGNASDVDFVEALDYFGNDPEVKAVVLHVEGLKKARNFMEVARKVAARKPVLALKAGKSEKGALTARSHTGSLTGRDEVYEAAFRQCGVIRVADFDELWDLARAFIYLPPMEGRRVGVLSFSGASGTMTADACARYGLSISDFTQGTRQALRAMSPVWWEVKDPVDIMPAALVGGDVGAVFTRSLETLIGDGEVDGIMYIVPSFPIRTWEGPGKMLSAVPLKRKPVVCWLVGNYGEEVKEEMDQKGMLIYPTVERGVRALAALARYREWREGIRGREI